MIGLRAMRACVVTAAGLLVSLASACSLPSASTGEGADVLGAWEFVGTQTAPNATLDGTLTVQDQAGGQISGIAGWEEHDGSGLLRTAGGPVSGRVIGESDIDFDIVVDGTMRRHVGLIRGDTISGNWVQLANGRSGSFRMERAP